MSAENVAAFYIAGAIAWQSPAKSQSALRSALFAVLLASRLASPVKEEGGQCFTSRKGERLDLRKLNLL